mmetsp:Transcript_2248/g.4264  ORF Transcript_2248/g.4264 Transcript_2248/m.4264 type:complete len:615 (+) Transcript_2248:930-2774(+)
MAPFGSSSFGSHLNPIATSTSGGIAQTMSLVFILRIILGIILIVRRSAVGRKVFLWKTPDSGFKIGVQAKQDRVPTSTKSCRLSTRPSCTVMSIVKVGAIGLAFILGTSRNQQYQFGAVRFKIQVPRKSNLFREFPPSNLEFTQCAVDKESLSYSSLAHHSTRKGPQSSLPPVRHSATIFQISFRMKYYIYEIKQCATKLISEIKTTMNHIWNLQPDYLHSLTPTSRNSGTGTPFQVILQLLITAKNEQEEKKLSLRRNSDIDKPIGSANTPYRQPMHIADDKPIGIIKNGHQQSIHFVDGNTSFLPSRNSDADAPTVVTLSSEEMLQLEMLQLGREAKTIESVLLFYFSTENEGDVFHHRQYHQLNQTLPWPTFNKATQASISDSYVGHYLQPRNTTIQHIVVLPSPLKLIVEFQASKLLASSSEGEYHILQVLSIVDSDPALLLIVGFNSFPRPPENEGEYQSSSSSTSSSTPAVQRPVSSTSVYEGEETASKPLPFDTVCEGEEKKHKMSWLSRKNRTQAITTTQIQSRTFVAAALFCISVAMATANGNINGRIDSSNIVRDIGSIGSSSSGTSAATSAAQRQQQQQHRLHSSQWQWLRRRELRRLTCKQC